MIAIVANRRQASVLCQWERCATWPLACALPPLCALARSVVGWLNVMAIVATVPNQSPPPPLAWPTRVTSGDWLIVTGGCRTNKSLPSP